MKISQEGSVEGKVLDTINNYIEISNILVCLTFKIQPSTEEIT